MALGYRDQDPNEVYDTDTTWQDYHDNLVKEGLSDHEIKSKMAGTKWENGPKYQEWAKGVVAPILGPHSPETEMAVHQDLTTPNTAGIAEKLFPLQDPRTLWERQRSKEETDVNSNYVPPTQDELKGVKKDIREKYKNSSIDTDPEFRRELKENGIETQAKGRMRNVWQAYNEGLISKDERNYLIFDAINTAMSNAGNTLLNIAAAYTGGSANAPTNQKSLYDERMAGVNKAATDAIQRDVEGSSTQAEAKKQALEREKADKQLAASRVLQSRGAQFREEAKNAQDPNKKQALNLAGDLMYMVSSGATENVGNEEYIAATVSNLAAGPHGTEILGNAMKLMNSGLSVMDALTSAAAKFGEMIDDGAQWLKDKVDSGGKIVDKIFNGGDDLDRELASMKGQEGFTQDVFKHGTNFSDVLKAAKELGFKPEKTKGTKWGASAEDAAESKQELIDWIKGRSAKMASVNPDFKVK